MKKAAYHEASHAVLAFLLGILFRSVTTKPHADSLGSVLFYKRPKWAIPNSESYNDWSAC